MSYDVIKIPLLEIFAFVTFQGKNDDGRSSKKIKNLSIHFNCSIPRFPLFGATFRLFLSLGISLPFLCLYFNLCCLYLSTSVVSIYLPLLSPSICLCCLNLFASIYLCCLHLSTSVVSIYLLLSTSVVSIYVPLLSPSV